MKRTTATNFNQEENDMKIFFEVKPVLAIAIAVAIEEMVVNDTRMFLADEQDELERVAKAIERQVHETN